MHEAAHPEANIIWGAVLDDTMNGEVKITVIATGFDKTGEAAATAAVGFGAGARSSVPPPDLEIPAFLRRAQK
jgi:cell division protein FtsZ